MTPRTARSRRTLARLILSFAALPALAGAAPAPRVQPKAFTPDPASVRRHGPAYKYPQQGWTVLHVEGSPYDRGYQHGRLLAAEIEAYVETLARYRDPKSPSDGWRELKNTANALFFRRYDKEYLEEMKGIADGAAAGGAKAYGTPLELLDIVALNSEIESVFVDEALAATAHGLEGKRYREPREGHCSAFVATGPATADGKAMLGHITMWNLYHARHFFVWIDIKPADGHRVVMQTYPGGIMSGMDYYQNDAGIAVCETTLDQTDFNVDGTPLCSRIRKALQYGDSIDDVVATLSEGNNGLYSNEWLIADAKTDEVAMFELGTHDQRLWRSGKDDWFGGTKGFYWGCNNAKDLRVRLETVPGLDGRPANVVFHPSDRDRKWLELFDSRRGSIGADFGFEAFTTPPLCAWPALDAKFATSDMIKDLKSFAIFGPPQGRTWEPTAAERSRYPDTGPLVSNDWTVLTTAAPRAAQGDRVAVDLDVKHLAARPSEPDGPRPPAWHGTLLPGAGPDLWLAAAFADYEPIVALEKALKAERHGGELTDADREHLERAMFGPASRYLSARARLGRDLAMSSIEPDPRDDAWYQIAAGRGVLVLAEVRKRLGPETFDALMDEFGRAHAGKPASTSAFFEAAAKAHGKPLDDLRASWLGADPLGDLGGDAAARWESGRYWSVNAFELDLENALIVYGTLGESAGQREAAERLQALLRRRWSNITVPIKSDRELAEADRAGRHLILVGRPETNSAASDLSASLPASFGPASFTLRGRTYAHPSSALIVAGPNPRDRAHSVVLFAGLDAKSTWDVVDHLPYRGASAEAVLIEAGSSPREMALPVKNEPIKSAARP